MFVSWSFDTVEIKLLLNSFEIFFHKPKRNPKFLTTFPRVYKEITKTWSLVNLGKICSVSSILPLPGSSEQGRQVLTGCSQRAAYTRRAEFPEQLNQLSTVTESQVQLSKAIENIEDYEVLMKNDKHQKIGNGTLVCLHDICVK